MGLDISSEALGNNDISSIKDHTFKVIDATRDYAVAYKPNFGFYERYGAVGFAWLEETVSYIGSNHITIADAKRGDIGNTAEQYAKSVFDHFGFDSVTLNPFMGSDSLLPFLHRKDKGAFILCRTSNASAKELQDIVVDGSPFYLKVAQFIKGLNSNDNVGMVVGATAPDELSKIRDLVPEVPILIPGVGAQGGNLFQSLKTGNRSGVGLINISRGISFIGDMSEKSIHSAAASYVEKMREILF